ncbi:hypothetical protein GE190_18445 [Acinetobacter baumannii]
MCIHLNLMIFTKIIRGFISTQQQWLKKRNACAANVSCISKAYQQRQKQLDTILQDRVLSHGPF